MIQKCSIWKVFAVFAQRPQKSFHVRELSKQINLSPTSVNIHLRKLEESRLIVKDTGGLYSSYRADFNNDYFRFYKKIHNMIQLRESGLIEELEDKIFPTAVV
ncbi:MAG: winged helix-turn-helix domain-containing protein, partial [archaeon]|nr:winged helix-turn-helix domain-containing protein [archaeon]